MYYTPTYIVEYIVSQTVGKLLEGKTPKQAASLTILDPACGSGSFLIGAYQNLLDWHLNWYISDGADKWSKGRKAVLYQGPGGAWRLTSAERKRILLNNIYGVDIDAQAVEVTKLSLLLKVLEGENAETINSTLKFSLERALPDLEGNIKCGNSLIGTDFYSLPAAEHLSEEELIRINPFDWKTGFKDITQKGGFDAVIGNPPYVSFGLRDTGTLGEAESIYLREIYANSAEYKLSLYAVFMQKGIDLLRENGFTSFIVPDSFLLGRYFSKIRKYTLDTTKIERVLFIKHKVFLNATVGTSIVYNFVKTARSAGRSNNEVQISLCSNIAQYKGLNFTSNVYRQDYFHTRTLNRFRLFFHAQEKNLVDKIEAVVSTPLSEILKISSGLIAKKGKDSIIANSSSSSDWKRGLLSGDTVTRYRVQDTGTFILWDLRALKSGYKDAIYNEPKLLGRQTGDRLIWGYDDTGLLCLNNLHVGNLKNSNYSLLYLLAILNSGMMNLYYRLISLELGRALAQTDIETLDTLPIRNINFSDAADKLRHDKIVSLVLTTVHFLVCVTFASALVA